MSWEAVIGLEVHCQLSTNSKIFSPVRSRLAEGDSVADEVPNSNANQICAGHPGTLPLLNRRAVEFAMKAGLATGCRINPRNVFSRKHYFYPDLPKGYQISQFDQPICLGGKIDVPTADGKTKEVTIQRIHMEEDAGKNVHYGDYSLVNLNRAGVPLIEIVSDPDMRTPEEAGHYLRQLYAVLMYLDITDGNLQEGNFRCDANVSIRQVGDDRLGTRTEIKNLNSFRFIEKAIEFEIARQIEVVTAGEKVIQETRGFDSASGKTISMRAKEEAHDYRYFPDPDLLPVVIDEDWLRRVEKSIPELPKQKKARYIEEFHLKDEDAETVTQSKEVADFFEETTRELGGVKKGPIIASHLLIGEVFRLMKEADVSLKESKLVPKEFSQVARLQAEDQISSSAAKTVLAEMWETGEGADQIVQRKGLKQVSDTSTLEPVIDQIIQNFPKQVADFKAGKEKLMSFFVGQAMKETKGKANPGMLQKLIREKLEE